jgi:hypothetical protein
MIYSTLKEVYNVDSFEKERDKDKKHKKKDCESNRKNKDLYIQSSPSFCTAPPSRKVAMHNVKPFLDDELEQYLDYSSVATPAPVTAQAVPSAVQPAPAVPPKEQPAPVTPAQAKPETVAPAKASSSAELDKKDLFYKNLINIGLFVFIGILIIFLCDQITEIAVNIGMKKTVSILEPYIARLEKLEKDRAS